MVNANFENSMLLGTHLENARINGANFKNTGWLTQDQIDDACGTPNRFGKTSLDKTHRPDILEVSVPREMTQFVGDGLPQLGNSADPSIASRFTS